MSDALPDWIDPESFQDYQNMRRLIKRPMTDRRMRQFMRRLYELKEAGHDVSMCLDEATDHQWLDVYPVRDKSIPGKPGSTWEQTQEYLRGESQRQATPMPDSVKALSPRLRRVG